MMICESIGYICEHNGVIFHQEPAPKDANRQHQSIYGYNIESNSWDYSYMIGYN